MSTPPATGAAAPVPTEAVAVHIAAVTDLQTRLKADLAELEAEIAKGDSALTRELAKARTDIEQGLLWIEAHLKKLI